MLPQHEMRTALIDALEDLSSSRTSRHTRALSTIEYLVAEACTKGEPSDDLTEFLRLQDGFECNVASRLALYLMYNLPETRRTLETLPSDSEAQQATLDVLTQPILQSLSILQGVSLIHFGSKICLGRRTSIQTLLDILSLSRHMPPPLQPTTNAQRPPLDTSDSSAFTSVNSHNSTFSSSTSANESRPPLQLPTLALAVLDTLLCILVDSPVAIRMFEELNGVEAVVKTLKRSGVARDVRVKCLEFLYFYLLPEDDAQQLGVPSNATRINDGPVHKVPARPTTIPSDTDTTPLSSPSRSQQSSFTTQSTTSLSSMDTPPPSSPPKMAKLSNGPSLPSSPIKSRPVSREHSQTLFSSSSNHSPFKSSPTGLSVPKVNPSPARMLGATNMHLAMLRREVDFVPQSPKKKQIARLGVGKPAPLKGSPIAGLGLGLGIGPGPLRRTMHDDVGGTPVKKPGTFVSAGGDSPHKGHGRNAPSSSLAASKEDDDESNVTQSSKRSSPFTVAPSPDTTIDDTNPEHPDNPARMPAPILSTSPSKPSASILPASHGISRQSSPSKRIGIRTTAEKKEMLGTWLGNVDALVEGVQRAGVWGLA